MSAPAIDRPTATTPSAASPPRLGPDDAVDLHLHTLASDGAWTPDGLIDHLVGAGIKVAAVCDHDTQRSVLEVIRLGRERGVWVVPGVEVTTRWSNRQWHLLVYGVAPDRSDTASEPFRALLAEQDAELQRLAEDARQRVEASARPIPSLPDVLAGRPMWPFHVLSALIKDGHCRGLKDAAELVVALGGNFTTDLPLARVVHAAHRAGGICVVAHPGRADAGSLMLEADLDAMLAEIPIDGLEAHYRSYTDQQTALYRRLAAERGLLVSCGSDSHAPKTPVDPRPWRAAWCAALLGRLGVSVEDAAAAEPDVWAAGMDALAVVPKSPAEQTVGFVEAAARAARSAADAAKAAANAALSAAEMAEAAVAAVRKLHTPDPAATDTPGEGATAGSTPEGPNGQAAPAGEQVLEVAAEVARGN